MSEKQCTGKLRIGRVKGFPRYRVLSTGVVYALPARPSDPPWRKLPLKPHPSGYVKMALFCDGRARVASLHHLVLEAFVGPRPEGMQCRHLDGNKENNCQWNLRWGTPMENGQDRVRHKEAEFNRKWRLYHKHGIQMPLRPKWVGQVRLPDEVIKEVRVIATKNRWSLNRTIQHLLTQALDRSDSQE